MASNSSLFIFSTLILFFFFFNLLLLHKQLQLSSSLPHLSSSLHQLKSKVSLLESIIEKCDHELRSMEKDIADIKKIILEKEEINTFKQNIENKIHLNQVLTSGSQVLIKYKKSVIGNAIQGLTRVRNWLDDSVGNDNDKDEREVIIQENL